MDRNTTIIETNKRAKENKLKGARIRKALNKYNPTIKQSPKQLLEIAYPIKSNYNTVIPLNIFQTWHTKTLPPMMETVVNKIKSLNPMFKHYLFDDDDCVKFITKYFKPDVLNAYNKLVPGAYKADLWRYCVLFIKGGIYLDIKYKPHLNFRFINLMESEHFCLDADGFNIYNAIMVCKPKNHSCLKAIRSIVLNVHTNYYGSNALEPTGPGLLARCVSNTNLKNIDLRHGLVNDDFKNRYIALHNYCILYQYNGYLDESRRLAKIPYYSDLWSAKQIYK